MAAAWVAGTVVWMAGSVRRASRALDRAVEEALTVANEAAPAQCMACPGQPVVADRAAHVRLFHAARTVGVEDRGDWGTR